MFRKNPVRSDGDPRSENKASATVRSVLYVVLVREEHGLRVVAVCVVERANQVFMKNPVRFDSKPRSKNKASATVRSVLNVVFINPDLKTKRRRRCVLCRTWSC